MHALLDELQRRWSPPPPVVQPGEFVFAAAYLEHGHIHGQCRSLAQAGATLRWVYDSDAEKVAALLKAHPTARAARSFDEILADPEVRLVAAAAIPSERYAIGRQVLLAGKDYFSDKAPFTTLAQLAQARALVAATGRKWAVYYSERIGVECAVAAGDLIAAGAIGRVVQVIGLGPHRHRQARPRPAWFYQKERCGGILCDIGSHQCEQFLAYAGARDGVVNFARVDNLATPDYPEFEDFGEASFTLDNGVSAYCRVDWFTPPGLRTWGDGRTVVLGTQGYLELRKYIDPTTPNGGDQLILVDGEGEHRLALAGKVGLPYFGQLIRDCREGTDLAMPQAHAFKAAELTLLAQQTADRARAAAPPRQA